MDMERYAPLSIEMLREIKSGDVIERMLGFSIPCYLVVQEVTETTIDCGWTFDRNTGLEIDADVSTPASYIKRVLTEEQKQIIKNGGKLE